MITEFKPNPDRNEQLVQLRRRDDEKVAYLRKGKKITGIFVAVAPILMLLYGFLCPSLSFFAMKTGDIGNKNVIVIFLFAAVVCAIILYINVLAREFLFKSSGYNILNRLDESLFLDGTQLEYGYRLRDSINIRERVTPHFDLLSMNGSTQYIFPLDKMKELAFDSKTQMIAIKAEANIHTLNASNQSISNYTYNELIKFSIPTEYQERILECLSQKIPVIRT